ncbi:hypothetical protein niasHS_011439 [Heterodera schachtii]|uniref:Uncharacterized protein n=1 Tax=Heterodera schachtii TaxID=97005 RepID=A0ABD2IQI6_HETSC
MIWALGGSGRIPFANPSAELMLNVAIHFQNKSAPVFPHSTINGRRTSLHPIKMIGAKSAFWRIQLIFVRNKRKMCGTVNGIDRMRIV